MRSAVRSTGRATPARGVNLNAVEFLQYMNQGLKNLHPSAILAAEDSTSFPKVTDPVSQGGLGFDYKWDMGWMNDTLDYFRTDPEYRTDNYHKLTFSMMYTTIHVSCFRCHTMRLSTARQRSCRK